MPLISSIVSLKTPFISYDLIYFIENQSITIDQNSSYLEFQYLIMSQTVAIRLIKSMSKSEKRHFKLQTKKQAGNKDYLNLFDLIDQQATIDIDEIRQQFARHHPGVSLNNTARYLVKLITDCLIQSKIEKDVQFQLMQQLMRVKILKERSLPEEGFKELKKIRESAVYSQQHYIQYFTYRYELDYFSDHNFQELTDIELIELQMKAKHTLKTINHIQEHHSLLELLKYRLVHQGRVLSEDDKKQLNDLMLSEMIIMAGKTQNSLAAQKLHLMFQSFFFTNIGDYQSALKTFHELNRLFEQNLDLLSNPPMDYLTALSGILDSLHTLGNSEEMAFYINKVKSLDTPAYPEYFRYMALKIVAANELAILIKEARFEDAVVYAESLPSGFLSAYNMVDEEKQWELYFYCSLSYFRMNNPKKAHKLIREIMDMNPPHPQLPIYKAVRLLNIIIYYEQEEGEYLEYEIRSYKRFFQQKTRLLKSEKLLFKIILSRSVRKLKDRMADPSVIQQARLISKDKYEKQVLKYFDFVEWIIGKMKTNP